MNINLLAFIAAIVLCFIYLYKLDDKLLFNQSAQPEHMVDIGKTGNVRLDTTMGPQNKPTFYLKDNRYNTNNSQNQTCGDSPYINSDNSCPKIRPFDWSVNQAPGANKTCGDTKWHYMEPRMTIIDNGMKCYDYRKDSQGLYPAGMDNITTYMNINDMGSDSILTPDIIPGYYAHHTLSPHRNNGIAPNDESDCVFQNVESSYKCVTGPVYNFHK
jgi:hypothetical protein